MNSNYTVRLMSLHHKINRKQMLLNRYDEYLSMAQDEHYSNWMLEDAYLETALAYEDAFNQTLYTPVGGYVDRYV